MYSLKKHFLFVVTLFTAISVSTGFGPTDFLKGTVNVTTFLDWFNNIGKYIHLRGLIVLDLMPILFLFIQAIIFYRDKNNIKGLFAVLSFFANIISLYLAIQYAHPIASQIEGWTPDKMPLNWISLKDSWLGYIGLQGLFGVLGWLFFLVTFFVPASKIIVIKQLPRFLNFSKNAILFLLTFVLGMGASSLFEFYLLPSWESISGATFIEMHRPLDLVIRKVGPVVFTIIVTLHVLLATLFFLEKSNNKAWLNIVAIIFLLFDTYIALQYNRPINDLFLTWTSSTLPENWASIRDEWLNYHFYRNILKTMGIITIFLIYFVPRNENITTFSTTGDIKS